MSEHSTKQDAEISNGEMSDFAKRLAKNENTPLLPDNKLPYVPVHLTKLQTFSFGLGHVINDIMGVLWFSYALVFLQIVVHLQSTISASLVFLGQCVDAVATPFIGVLIDKYGTKKKWNAFGVTLTAISFPFIFHIWNDTSWRIIAYYALAVIFFQIGWAIVQISHLSLIAEMTVYLQERADLTTLRYTIHVCSNIVIYVMAYFVLQESKTDTPNIIEPRDGWKFEIVGIIAVVIGVFCSMIFQCMLRIPTTSNKNKIILNQKLQTWKKICSICCNSKLYLVALIHTTSRVFHALNLVYTPFFINETKVSNSGILAIAPFLTFVASLATSLVINSSAKLYNSNKTLFTTGTTFLLLNCACIYLNRDESDDPTFIYAASIFCGVGSAMTIITSLCIAANFIGNDTAHSAFIYGIITFTDKIINGIIIFVIEYVKNFDLVSYDHYYKFVLTFVNGVITGSGYIFLMLLPSSVCYSS